MVMMLVLAQAVAISSGATPPKGIDPETWIRSDDYPRSALVAEVEGATQFGVVVDRLGKAQHCEPIGSSGSDVLDDVTCLLIRERARFIPAKDALGQPTEGFYRSRVRWQLPDASPDRAVPAMPLVPQDLTIEFKVDAKGAVADCKSLTSGPVELPIQPCDMFEGTTFAPELGKARGVRRVRFQTTLTIEPEAPPPN